MVDETEQGRTPLVRGADLFATGCRQGSNLTDDHVGGFTHVRIRIANGSEQIRQRCAECEDVFGRSYGRLRFTPDQIAAMPVVQDWTATRPPCVRCGAWGTEEHHWAPRAIFGEESDLWPVAWLCPNCHQRWHQSTGVATG